MELHWMGLARAHTPLLSRVLEEEISLCDAPTGVTHSHTHTSSHKHLQSTQELLPPHRAQRSRTRAPRAT